MGKWALGILSALAVVGGAMLTAMFVIYVGASEYVPELNEIGGWGILAGALALAIYVTGALRTTVAVRIGAGLGLAVAGLMVSMMFASVVSLAGDRGGERGTLEDATAGFVWLLVGLFFFWSLATGRWPVARKR